MIFFIIPKTTGFGLSKRRVSFHKTTRIFFEGFSHPSFFVPGSESAPGSEFALVRSETAFCSFWVGAFVPGSEPALLFVSLLFFARSCSLFACFSTFLVVELYFFLDFVWWFWSCAYFCGAIDGLTLRDPLSLQSGYLPGFFYLYYFFTLDI